MVDFIKIWGYLDNYQKNQLMGSVDFSGSYNIATGESISINSSGKNVSPHLVAYAKNMKIKLYPNGGCQISGSLHKYYNDGKHNFNFFGRSQLSESIQTLSSHLKLDIGDFRLVNIEIGVNIIPPVDSDTIINNAFMYKNKVFENKFHSDEGNYKQASLSDYKVKLYNKRKHYTSQGFYIDTEILRFELKYNVMRTIKDLGVCALNEAESSLDKLKIPLIEAWEHVLMYDQSLDDYLTEKKRLQYSNPNYWIDLKSNNQRSFKRHSNNLKRLHFEINGGVFGELLRSIPEMSNRIVLN